MIGKLTYDQVLEFAKKIREQNNIIKELLKGRDVEAVVDFTDVVESYCKFLEGTVDLNQAADNAIQEMIK